MVSEEELRKVENEEEDKGKWCDCVKIPCKSLFTLFIMILSLLDFWLDFLLAITYAMQGESLYAFFTFFFTLVPTVGGAVYTVRFIKRNGLDSMPDKIAMILCFLLQTHFVVPIWFFVNLFGKRKNKKSHESKTITKGKEKVATMLKMFDTCEALPQLAFQFSILLGKQGFATYLQFHSILISFITGSWKLTELLDVKGAVNGILGFANFCWLLPSSIIMGMLAYDAKIVSYIVTPLKLFLIVGMNMLYLRRKSNPSQKKWSDWLKSIVFSMFVPFYMFSRIGAYIITSVLCLQMVLAPVITEILRNGEIPRRESYNITEFCTKCNQSASFLGFFDILFDSKQRIDLNTLFHLAYSTVMLGLIVVGAIISLILLGCCCCCRKRFTDIESDSQSLSSEENGDDGKKGNESV